MDRIHLSAICLLVLDMAASWTLQAPRALAMPDAGNEKEPFILYTHEEDSSLQVRRYLPEQKLTEQIGTIPAREGQYPHLGILPDRSPIIASSQGRPWRPALPTAYLDWRTLEVLGPERIPTTVEGRPARPLGYWEGRWVVWVEDKPDRSKGPGTELFLGAGQEWKEIGHMRISSVMAQIVRAYHSFSPDGRWLAWLDEDGVYWLDMATGQQGSVERGDEISGLLDFRWLPNSQGLVFWGWLGSDKPFVWRVLWLVGPRAGDCLTGEPSGRPYDISPDGRFLAVGNGTDPPFRIAKVPGADDAPQGRPVVGGRWFIDGSGMPSYSRPVGTGEEWFRTTLEGHEVHAVPTGYRASRAQVVSGEHGGRVALILRNPETPPGSLDYSLVVADFSGQEVLRTRIWDWRTEAVGQFLSVIAREGEEWVVRRFDLLTGQGEVVFRSQQRLSLRKAGDYLLLSRSSRPSPPFTTESEVASLTSDLLVSSDAGASWNRVATEVFQWGLSDGKALAYLETG